MPRYEYGPYKPKWYNPAARIPLVESTMLRGADIASGTLGVATSVFRLFGHQPISVKDAADAIAREEVAMKVVTGHDHALNPLVVGIIGGAEVALSISEQVAAFAAATGIALVTSLGLDFIPVELVAAGAAAALDAGVDLAVGKGLEFIHYRRARRAGLPISAIKHAVRFAGIAPVIPVAPTLAFLQWYGRARGRELVRKRAKGKIS